MTDIIEMIERGWREQGMKGDMPVALLEAITDGATGYDKRIVRNLAMHSVLISENGAVYKWDEIVKQWSLKKIRFGTYDTCAICSRHPIIEHCILTNEITGAQVTVGNRCVLRYLNVIIEGDSDEEKSRFIKERFNQAKQKKRVRDFKARHPTFWQDMKRHEAVLIAYRPKLMKAIANRMNKHSYLSIGLEQEWIDFLILSESLSKQLKDESESKNKRYNALREQQNAIASLRQTELNSVRLKRKEMAKRIEGEIEVLSNYASDDEILILAEQIQFIAAGGLPSKKALTLYQVLKHRKSVEENGSDEHDAEQQWIYSLDTGRLTKAERLFRLLIISKPSAKVNAGERSAIRRMKQRY